MKRHDAIGSRRAPRRAMRGREAGLSLLEVMVAISILGVVLMSMGMLFLRVSNSNWYDHDRALAQKACMQVLETIRNSNQNINTLKTLYDGKPIQVFGMMTARGQMIDPAENPHITEPGIYMGLITFEDIGWDGTTGDAYLIRVDVFDTDPDDGARGMYYARAYTVRTR